MPLQPQAVTYQTAWQRVACAADHELEHEGGPGRVRGGGIGVSNLPRHGLVGRKNGRASTACSYHLGRVRPVSLCSVRQVETEVERAW